MKNKKSNTQKNLSEKYTSQKNKYKILILGHNYVGLTAFFHKLKTGKFDPCLPYRLGIETYEMIVKMEDNRKVPFKIYDTKGQEKEREIITRVLFKETDGVILIYSIDNKESFDDLENWLRMLKEDIKTEIPIFLIGNKRDLEEERIITFEQGAKFAEKHGFMFSECSVRCDSWDEIKSIVEKLAKTIYEKNNIQTRLKILNKYLSF